MTTSNSPPSVAVDAVIFARAWFSGSATNFSRMPGLAASNWPDSEMASFICGFDTIAMTSVRPLVPSAPARAQLVSARTKASTSSGRRALGMAHPWEHLHLEARAAAHQGQRVGVLPERQGIREQGIRVDSAGSHQVERGAEAVQHRHRAD